MISPDTARPGTTEPPHSPAVQPPPPDTKTQSRTSTRKLPASFTKKVAPKEEMQSTSKSTKRKHQAPPSATQPGATHAPPKPLAALQPPPPSAHLPSYTPTNPFPGGPTPTFPRISALQKKLTTFHYHISGLQLRLKRLEAVKRPDAEQQRTMHDLRAWIENQEGTYRRWESLMTGAVQWDYVRWAGRIDEKGMRMLEGYIWGLETEMVDW